MIECPVCDAESQTTGEVDAHLKAEHADEFYPPTTNGRSLTCRCDNCGDSFERSASQIGTRQYCCLDCANEAKVEDGTEYGKRFQEAREEALEQAGGVCESCGLDDRGHRRIYGRSLEGHHIERVRTFENADDAHTPENILILCKQCHRLRHA